MQRTPDLQQGGKNGELALLGPGLVLEERSAVQPTLAARFFASTLLTISLSS